MQEVDARLRRVRNNSNARKRHKICELGTQLLLKSLIKTRDRNASVQLILWVHVATGFVNLRKDMLAVSASRSRLPASSARDK